MSTITQENGEQVIEVQAITGVTVKKEQKVSISYTLKAMANNTKKLEENKIITKDEAQQLKKLHKTAVERWIGLEMGI